MSAVANAAKKPPAKDMKSVIAQFEQGNKTTGLRPVLSTKPTPADAKPSMGDRIENIRDVRLRRTSVPDKLDDGGKPRGTNTPPADAANPFKVALKPVSRTPGSGAGKPSLEAQPAKSVTGQTPKSASSVSDKSKLFEAAQKDSGPETLPATTKPKPFAVATLPKPTVASKMQGKDASVAETMPKLSNTVASSPVGKKVDFKTDKATPDKIPRSETDKESTARSDDVQQDMKRGLKPVVPELESTVGSTRPSAGTKSGGKPPVTINTLTKPSKVATPSTTSKTAENTDDSGQAKAASETDLQKNTPTLSKKSDKLKTPSVGSNKSEEPGAIASQPPVESSQPKIPPRKDQNKTEEKLTEAPVSRKQEDTEQPKIPPRREQPKREEKAADKQISKQPAKDTKKLNETKEKKGKEMMTDNKANKVEPQNFQSLLRNKARPLPKPAKENYRLLPVPKASGKPPRKKARPPCVDLSKYATNVTSKAPSVPSRPLTEPCNDDDDIYEDCDNIPVMPVTRESSRISEYTEEEEAKMEKIGRVTSKNTMDNYGKMICNTTENYDDDDEIYQEID